MKSFEQLARSAHEAFLKERKAQGSTGTEYIGWETLPLQQRSAWIAAAKQIVAEMATVH